MVLLVFGLTVSAQAPTPVPVVIGTDTGEAITDALIVYLKDESNVSNPVEATVARFRTSMQQGVTVDISGKLDRDLGNVATVPAPGAFRLAIDAASRTNMLALLGAKLNLSLSPIPNAAVAPQANRDAFRNFITAKKNDIVASDSTSTGQWTVGAGEIIYFSDISEHYANISGQSQTRQARLIPTDPAFTRAHLPRVSSAERTAGTSDKSRAFSPQDITAMITAHGASGNYADLAGRPFIYVAPGDALPTPTAANSNLLAVAGTGQGRIIYHQSLQHGSDLSVTYRAFNSTDLDTGNYRGEVNYVENLPSDANNGDVYFVRNDHHLRIWNDLAGEWGAVFWQAGEWLGSFHSKSAADQAVAAHYPSGGSGSPVGDHLSYGATVSQQDLYTITAYTPDVADVRTWTPVFTSGGGGTATADGTVDGVDLSLSGQTLTLEVDLTVGGPFTDSVTLPAGGGTFNLETGLAGLDEYDDGETQVLIQDEGDIEWNNFGDFLDNMGANVPVNHGGTGASNATGARTNIGLANAINVIGTPSDGQVVKWDDSNSRWAPADDQTASSGGGEENVQADWDVTDTNSDAFIKNKPCIVTAAVETGQGGCLVAVSAGDIRYHRKGGDDVPIADGGTGAGTASGARTNLGLGSAATHNVGTASGQVPELESAGNIHPRRLANNTPEALATEVQFLGNNTTTTARWRDLDGYAEDYAGELLDELTEFEYDTSTNTLTFNASEFEEHFKGDYDNGATYVVGDYVEHNDGQWFVHDATLANANAPADPVATTGWSRWSGRSDWRGTFDNDDTTSYDFQTGDRVTIVGDHTYFLTGPDASYTPVQIQDSAAWTVQLRTSDITGGAIQAAIHGHDSISDHDIIVFEGSPENRLEYHSLIELTQMITASQRLLLLTELLDEVTGSPSDDQVLGWDAPNSRYHWITAAGISQASGDARYARLASANNFTQALTVTRAGNNTAVTINGAEATGQAILKINTNNTGAQKAFQAQASGEGSAWASFERSFGSGNDAPGFALGTGLGRDVNLYRGGANVLRTDDTMSVASLQVDSAGRTNSRTQLGLGTAFTSVSADSGGIDFTQANGGTVEITSAELVTASGADKTTVESDAAVSITTALDAVLTSFTPPSGCRSIMVSFRRDSSDSWTSEFTIPYARWNAFSTVAAGTDLTSSNSVVINSGLILSGTNIAEWFVGKGTGGVLAVASESTGVNYKFDMISVRWLV